MEKEEFKNQLITCFKSEGLDVSKEKITGLINSLTDMGVLQSIAHNSNGVYTFLRMCLKLGLDPELKEIYAIPYDKKFSIVIDYHQYIKRAARSPNYQGFNVELIDKDEAGNLLPKKDIRIIFSCRPKNWDRDYISIFKMNEGDTGQSTGITKSTFMLQKVAIKNGLAHCFPEDLAVFDSIEQAEHVKEAEALKVENTRITKGTIYDE